MQPGWVWAPKAQSVELVLFEHTRQASIPTAARRLPLVKREGGWWAHERTLRTKTLYCFSLDGGPELPDPRSRYQPYGLPGPSQVVDPNSFAWSKRSYTPPALSGAVFYEVHVGSFSPAGNYRGVCERLAHLERLGVTHLELMPVHQFPGQHGWGYDGVQLYAPFHRYGPPDDLKQLVDDCHARGIAVILDVVYNHVGPDQNTLNQFGPYLRRDARTPWGHGYNLDGSNSDEVRRFVLDNARLWLEDYRFDGLRLDAVHTIQDAHRPHLLDDLARQTKELERRLGRRLWLFAEAEARRPELTAPRRLGGHALSAQWDDDLHYAAVGSLTPDRAGHYGRLSGLENLADALRGRPLRALAGNHRELPVPADRLITCLQNHDRIGNRPDGQRFAAQAGAELDQLAALLMFTSPLHPLLFMGQEWGALSPFYYFADHQRQQLVRSVRRGRAREMKAFGWQRSCPIAPDSPRAFADSHLRWSELESPHHCRVLAFYTRLVALRKRYRELRRPAVLSIDEHSRVLRMRRETTRVFANLGKRPRRFRVEPGSKLLLASRDGVDVKPLHVELPPMTACLILRGQPGQAPRGGTKSRTRS